jgi:hypothetical protein
VGLVAEVGAGFQELAHGEIRQSHRTFSFFRFEPPQATLPKETGTAEYGD